MASSASSGVAIQGQPTTRFFIICGAEKVDDVGFFENFLGFCQALRSLGVKETFWNCFPVEKYFDDEGNKSDDIKFGRRGSARKPVQVYSKHDWTNGQKFWRQISPAEMDNLVVQAISHMEETARELVAGDIFNLLLVGHGTPSGILLGGNKLLMTDLALALNNFKVNVRVNVVIQSCRSEAFADKIQALNQPQGFIHPSLGARLMSDSDIRTPSSRFTSSRFGGAFLRNLGLAHDPRTKLDWSPDAHAVLLQKEEKTIDPWLANPRDYRSADMGLVSRFIDVLFTDYVDLSFSQANQAARRVITPTNPAPPPTANTNMTSENLQATEGVLESEMSLVETDDPIVQDCYCVEAYYNNLYFKKTHKMIGADLSRYGGRLAAQLEGLRWRFRLQELFWFAVEALANKDLLKLENIHSPIVFWDEASEAIQGVYQILNSFKLVQQCDTMTAPGLEGSFPAPVTWLTVLLVRCGTDIQKTFEFLMTMRILGEFDEAHFNSVGEAS